MIFKDVRAHWHKTKLLYYKRRAKKKQILNELQHVFYFANLEVKISSLQDFAGLVKAARVVTGVRHRLYKVRHKLLDNDNDSAFGEVCYTDPLDRFDDELYQLLHGAPERATIVENLRLMPPEQRLELPYYMHVMLLYNTLPTQVEMEALRLDSTEGRTKYLLTQYFSLGAMLCAIYNYAYTIDDIYPIANVDINTVFDYLQLTIFVLTVLVSILTRLLYNTLVH